MRSRGFEPRVVVDGTRIRTDWVLPESTDEYHWDDRIWDVGCMHFDGYANTIDVRPELVDETVPPDDDPDDPELAQMRAQLYPSRKYTDLMRQEVTADVMETNRNQMIQWLLYGVLGLSGLVVVLIVLLVNGGVV